MTISHVPGLEVNPHVVRCAMLRVAVGLLTMLTLWDYLDLLTLHFSDRGWYPPHVSASPLSRSVIEVFTPQVVRGVFWVCFLSSFFFMMGLRTRTAGVLTLLGLYAIYLRNSFLTDADDEILRSTLFVLLFAPLGAFWSFDAATSRAASGAGLWPLRVIRFKLAFLYLGSGAEKLLGSTWSEGTAISLTLNNPAFARFRTPSALEPLFALATPCVPYLELLLALLLSLKPTRRFGVALGITFHLMLAAVLELRWLTAIILAHYLAFISDRQVTGLVQLLHRVRKFTARTCGAPPSPR